MNILIIMPVDSLNGAEQYLKMIAKYYSSHEVSIYFLKNTHSSKWNDLQSQCNLNFMSSKGYVNGLLKFIKKIRKDNQDFDYIFTSHVYTNSLIGILLSVGAIKTDYFIARESTSIFLRYRGLKLLTYKFAYFIGYRKMDLLICQTRLMHDQLIQYFSTIQKRTELIILQNPINLSGSEALALAPLPEGFPKYFMVSAGRLIEEKGFDILIQSFLILKKSHPNLKLVILGEGDSRVSIETLISKLNLNNEVFLTGQVNNVYKYFKNAQLCVVSSRIEGFPNVLLQMMSQNTNVVSTLCAGGINKIPGIYTCSTQNIKKLHTAIDNCLKENNSKNRQIFDNYLKARNIENFMYELKRLISR